MKFKNTLEIVTKDIQDIDKLISNFKNYSSLPKIELDLALSKLRNVYDILLILRESSFSESVMDGKNENPADAELQKTPVSDLSYKIIPDLLTGEMPVQMHSPLPSDKKVRSSEDISDTGEIPAAEKKTGRQKKSPSKGEKTIGDKFATDQSFMNEKLGEKLRKADISSVLQSAPIKTISASMGINDKFFFIRELFNSDTDLFRQTLNDLDNSSNFNTAYNYLMDKFGWDMESEPVQKLLNLVRRKFISPGNE